MPRFQTRPVAPAEVEAMQLRCSYTFGKSSGRAGDWLVTHPDDRQEIVKDAAFQATYEPVDGNGAAPRAGARATAPAGRARKAPRAPAKRDGRSKLSDEQLAAMRREFEAGVPSKGIGKHFGVTDSAVYLRAKAGGWKRPKGAYPPPAPTPKGEQLSGSVKCTNPECGVMTDFDPCRKCGVKLKRKW